jgi:HAD superfamily hydrolase (TIGR01509 family)
MNIIIPLGGKGDRFKKNGYEVPKPLIKVFEKTMIEYVLDNLSLNNEDKIFIIYNFKLNDYNFFNYIKQKYNFIELIEINQDTKGAAETLFLGLNIILNKYEFNEKCLLLDCDTFYTENIVEIFRNINYNTIFYTKNYDCNPIYSYIELDNDKNIINISEKNKISDNANTGAYSFIDINILYDYCKYVLENNITFNNEPYTSCIISEMLKSNIIFKGYELNDEYVISLGTPLAVEKYINKTYAFLFDLDGTMVKTDDIYYEVWKEILMKYNIILNEDIFKKYIFGNNDNYVKNILLKNENISLNELSEIKDNLFIEKIDNIVMIDGIYEFINKIKLLGHKLCVVTNCNRKVAEKIINYVNINNFIDFIISSNDCVNGKPDSEPYIKAMLKYNISNDKCFIFEDSKTGILSAKNSYPKLLIGIENNNSDELINYGVNMTINNFLNIELSILINYECNNNIINNLKELILKNSTIKNIKNIEIDDKKLKGGFIADVIKFKIETNDDLIIYQILKYESKVSGELNNLSKMAKQIKLYEREYYFYTNIYPHVNNIKIPKFYNLMIDESGKNIGVILENLLEKNYKNNLNLNEKSINVTLTIIDRMAQMHASFWNKNLKDMFPELKNTRDNIFYPFLINFINEKYNLFKTNWFSIINEKQQNLCDEIYYNFNDIQKRLSEGNHLTFIHGDIKSPNIFYDEKNNYEPYFIDWQHCAVGKGVQDLIFFIIESFDIENIESIFYIAKYYYYKKIVEYGVKNYSFQEYENDIYDAICYVPFFTGVWFGTTSSDELIDKNFPYLFISKMFHLIKIMIL